MSGLIGDLYNNTRALNAHSAGLQAAGRNLANVNNPSYARQRVNVETYAGPGKTVFDRAQVEHIRDRILDKNISFEAGNTGRLDALQSLYSDLKNVLGETVPSSLGATLSSGAAGSSGFTGAISAFFNAWEGFSAAPNDPAAKALAFERSRGLADSLNAADRDLDKIASNLDARLTDQVKETNRLLGRIASLNEQIVRQEARHPGEAVDLRDARQKAVEELSRFMEFEQEELGNGGIRLTLADPASPGQSLGTLVEGSVAASVLIVREDELATGLASTFEGSTVGFTPSKGSLSVLHPAGGRAELEAFRGQLDAFAAQLSSSANGAYAEAAGAPALFSGSSAKDISLAVGSSAALVAASAVEGGGGNTVASAIAALSSSAFSTTNPAPDLIDGTFSGFATLLATDRAAALADVNERSGHQSLVVNMLEQQRSSISGVSLDEELTDMMRLQKAFQASARVINTINSMLELVTTRLGA